MFLCRESPARGTTTDASAVRLPISRTATHLRRQCADWCVTTTDVPTRARTSMPAPTPTPTLMLRHSSGRRLRTLQCWPCCYATARSPRPPRSDECANS
jgi:hypothetical protein